MIQGAREGTGWCLVETLTTKHIGGADDVATGHRAGNAACDLIDSIDNSKRNYGAI